MCVRDCLHSVLLTMKGELRGLGSVVASWLSGLWRLQSDTLGSSPAVAGFSLFSFLPKQVEFHLNLHTCMSSFSVLCRQGDCACVEELDDSRGGPLPGHSLEGVE